MERQKNDATLSKLGDIYQYYVATLDCFKMVVGDKIQIEIQGDITCISGDKIRFQKEVKHHVGGGKLTDRNSEMWKTLKNWTENYEQSIRCDKLILHTTSEISDTSIYHKWDKKNGEEKYKLLFDVGVEKQTREKEFREFYDKIFISSNISKDELCRLLEKVYIKSSQGKIERVMEEFDGYLLTIPKINRESYISSIVGMVQGKVTTPPYKWEVTFEEFQTYLQTTSPAFVNSEMIPLSRKFENITPDNEATERLKDKKFVSELHKIDNNTLIPIAISDYWRTINTILDSFDKNISRMENLDTYKKNLNEQMFYKKLEMKEDFTAGNRDDAKRLSRKLCANILALKAEDFGGISSNQMFFKNGVVHSIVDEEKFVWDLGVQDEP